MFHFSSLINKTMCFTFHSYFLKFFPCCQQDSSKCSKKGVFQCLLQKEAYFGLAFWKLKHPTPSNWLSSSWGNVSVLHKPPLIAQRVLEEQLLGQQMCRIKAGCEWVGWKLPRVGTSMPTGSLQLDSAVSAVGVQSHPWAKPSALLQKPYDFQKTAALASLKMTFIN